METLQQYRILHQLPSKRPPCQAVAHYCFGRILSRLPRIESLSRLLILRKVALKLNVMRRFDRISSAHRVSLAFVPEGDTGDSLR